MIKFVVRCLLEGNIRVDLLGRKLSALNEKESLTKGNMQEAKCLLNS
jgi:hypothetical protein